MTVCFIAFCEFQNVVGFLTFQSGKKSLIQTLVLVISDHQLGNQTHMAETFVQFVIHLVTYGPYIWPGKNHVDIHDKNTALFDLICLEKKLARRRD